MGQPQSHALSVAKNVVAFSMGDVCVVVALRLSK